MMVYKISINGKDECVAGIEDLGVLHAMLSYAKRGDEPKYRQFFEVAGLIENEHL